MRLPKQSSTELLITKKHEKNILVFNSEVFAQNKKRAALIYISKYSIVAPKNEEPSTSNLKDCIPLKTDIHFLMRIVPKDESESMLDILRKIIDQYQYIPALVVVAPIYVNIVEFGVKREFSLFRNSRYSFVVSVEIPRRYLDKNILARMSMSFVLEAVNTRNEVLYEKTFSLEDYRNIYPRVDDPRVTKGYVVIRYIGRIPKNIVDNSSSLRFRIYLTHGKDSSMREFMVDSETVFISETIRLYEFFNTKRLIKKYISKYEWPLAAIFMLILIMLAQKYIAKMMLIAASILLSNLPIIIATAISSIFTAYMAYQTKKANDLATVQLRRPLVKEVIREYLYGLEDGIKGYTKNLDDAAPTINAVTVYLLPEEHIGVFIFREYPELFIRLTKMFRTIIRYNTKIGGKHVKSLRKEIEKSISLIRKIIYELSYKHWMEPPEKIAIRS